MKSQLLTLVMLCVMTTLTAQIKIDSTFSISGSADMYFRTNVNSTNDFSEADLGATLAPATSFANLPGFSMGMFNLIGNYEGKKVGFTADLVFGPRGADAVFGSTGSANIVNQLFGYWNVTDKFKLTLGNFNTFLGYEVISPTLNFNYSTSYMFSYGPFSHAGLKADFELGGGFTGMVGVFNETDATEFSLGGDFVGGAQLGYSNDKGGAWLNFILADGFYQVDLTTGWQATEKFYVGLNATSAQEAFYGAALYLQVAATDALSLGIRGEYFADENEDLENQIVGGKDENVIDVTLSANYKIGNLTIIPEVRLDKFSSDMVYPDGFDLTKTQDNLTSFLLAAVYSF